MSKSPKPKKCIKDKVKEASDLTDQVKRETALVKELFLQEEKEAKNGQTSKRKIGLSRS